MRPLGAAIPSAKSIKVVEIPLALAANQRCAVGLLTAIAARKFRLLKFILHSELRRRAASCRALPCTSSFVCGPKFITSRVKVW